MKYQIWHDNDFDAAAWFFENLEFGENDSVELRQIPKTNNSSDLRRHLSADCDLALLPVIRLETPDIILIREDEVGDGPEVLLVVELMTHTPQHDHPLQRYSRLYNAAKIGVPSFLVLPTEKEKLERGKKDAYKPTMYRANPLAYHLFIETTEKFGTDCLLINWPTSQGYLKYDKAHPTAPRNEGEILDLFAYAQKIINSDDPSIVGHEILRRLKRTSGWKGSSITADYALSTVFEAPSREILSTLGLESEPFSRFRPAEQSILYSPNGLKSGKNDFRTDPYGGKLCAFDVLFCRDTDGVRIKSLILMANKVSAKHNGESTLLGDWHDVGTCPFVNPSTWKLADSHFEGFCPYLLRKQQRIFGEIPDLVVFEHGGYFEA